jgi:Zn-dependent M28 family amino/carboxypeptidase
VTDPKKLDYFKRLRSNPFNAAGIIEIEKKLTWDQSPVLSKYPKVKISGDSLYRYNGYRKTKGFGRIWSENTFVPNYSSQNVIAFIPGRIHPDSFIVFSAHYDHLGYMGKNVYFPGANDNASGCAMLLSLAKYYTMPEHRPKYTVVFIAFGGEEVGLIGSKYFTEHPVIPMRNIRFLLNMDIMGTGEEGITAVNGTLFKEEFDALKRINTEENLIADVKMRGKAANSDHYYFSEKGVKAFFIYTMGGIKAYHDIYDRAETLPLNEFEDLFRLITKFGDHLQE